MATLLSRVSRAIMAEEYPRDRIFWFLEMVALGFVLEAIGALFRGEFGIVVTAMASAFVFGLVAFHWKSIRWVAGSVVALACIAASFWWWSSHKPGFVILYGNSPLDSQTVILSKPQNPTRPVTQMYVWPIEKPTMFGVHAVVMRNAGDVALQPDAAYLSFDSEVQKWQLNSGLWEMSPDRNTPGWTTYRSGFSLAKLEADHAWPIADFVGTPIPNRPMRVRLTLVWGSKETTAAFTIMPPSP